MIYTNKELIKEYIVLSVLLLPITLVVTVLLDKVGIAIPIVFLSASGVAVFVGYYFLKYKLPQKILSKFKEPKNIGFLYFLSGFSLGLLI